MFVFTSVKVTFLFLFFIFCILVSKALNGNKTLSDVFVYNVFDIIPENNLWQLVFEITESCD